MKGFIYFLKIIMIPLVAIYPLFMNLLGGISLVVNGKKFLIEETITQGVMTTFYILAALMFLSSVLFSAAMVFALCKLNKISLVIDIIAMLMCAASTIFMDLLLMSNNLTLISVKPLTDNVLVNHLPTIAPFLAIFIVALAQNVIKDTALGPVWDNFKQNKDNNQRIISEGRKAIKEIAAGNKDGIHNINNETAQPEDKNSKKGKKQKKSGKKKK